MLVEKSPVVLLVTLVDLVVVLVLLQVLVPLVLLHAPDPAGPTDRLVEDQVSVREDRMAGSSWNSSEAMHLPASKRLRKVQLGFASQALAFWMYKLQSCCQNDPPRASHKILKVDLGQNPSPCAP